MKEISQLTACFVDHGGLYLPLAQKLSQAYGRVLYHDPAESRSPKIQDAVIGESYPDDPRLERIEEFWTIKRDIDFFIFPDSQGAGLQAELVSQGFPVWGSRRSIQLEQSREKFHAVLENLGLEAAPYTRVVGMTRLRDFLKDKEDQYIKCSKYRGTLETFHWRSWDDDECFLDLLAVKLGGIKELFPFLVFPAIDTEFELGGDTYCIRGQFPHVMIDGYEWKDKGYFGAIKKRTDAPAQLQEILDAFGPLLGDTGHNNFWTMEVRVKDDHSYFIDPTPRGPMPATGSQMEVYANLPEIILAGANGELEQPKVIANFSAECALTTSGDDEIWANVKVPEELEQWMKLSASCTVNGRKWFPPDGTHDQMVGWLVAIGDTPKETIETILGYAGKLPDGISANTESLVNLLKEIHKAEAENIEFTPMPVPPPEIVVADHES